MQYLVKCSPNQDVYCVTSPTGWVIDSFVYDRNIPGSRFRAIRQAVNRAKTMQACWDGNVKTRTKWVASSTERFHRTWNNTWGTLSTQIRV